MDKIYLILDITAAAVILCGIVGGMKKGFLRTVLTAAVYLLAVIGAAVVSNSLSEPLYDEYCKSAVISAVENEIINTEEQLKNALSEAMGGEEISSDEEKNISSDERDLTNPEISDKLNNMSESVFDSFRFGLDETLSVTVSDKLVYDDMKSELLRFLSDGDTLAAAEYIEEAAVRGIIVKIIEYVLWSVSFIVISIVGKAVVRTILAVRKIELVKSADMILGGVLGFVKSLLIFSLLVIIIKLIIGITGGIGYLSEEAVQNTILFKFLYNLFDIL